MNNNEAIKNDKKIKLDRLRYSKNSVPALLTYLGIIFNVIYFIGIYRVNFNYFYKFMIFVSVLTNLLFLLIGFLSSEGIKNYKKTYSYVLFGLGLVQIVRIFIFPVGAAGTNVMSGEEVIGKVLTNGQFIKAVLFLVLSSASMISAGLIGLTTTSKLENYVKTLKK